MTNTLDTRKLGKTLLLSFFITITSFVGSQGLYAQEQATQEAGENTNSAESDSFLEPLLNAVKSKADQADKSENQQNTETSANQSEEPMHAAANLGEVNVNNGFAPLVKAVKPAVVNISVTSTLSGQNLGPNQEELEEFFRRFFGDIPGLERRNERGDERRRRGPVERRTMAVGSGFIVSSEGLVVTNNHVIDGADEIEVVFNDGKRVPAKLRGTDPKTDLALLEIDTDQPLPYVVFGDSDDAQVGDWIIAIGNPFGLGGTTTSGIISARGRDIQFSPLDDFIQIDAPINQGNSGGPLFNTRGEVIGVNSAIYSPNGGSVGIGFAIPSTMAKNVIAQLSETGSVKRGFLGVQIQTVDEELAQGFGLEEATGASITKIVEDSPAQEAGLQVGDIILEFNGEEVKTMRELPKLVARVTDQQEVKVVIWRNQQRQTLQVTIGINEEESERAIELAQEDNDKGNKFGIVVESLNQNNRNRYQIDDDIAGVIITEVKRGSIASQHGLREGDIISRIGSTEIYSASQLQEVLEENQKDTIAVLVIRGGQPRFIPIVLNKDKK